MGKQGPGDPIKRVPRGDGNLHNSKGKERIRVKKKRGDLIRYDQVRVADKVLQKGTPGSVTQEATRGKETREYVPITARTDKKEYGAEGGGTDEGMNKLLDKAHREQKEVTDYGTEGRSKGLHYRAGKWNTKTDPPTMSTKIKNPTPEISVPRYKKVPVYAKTTQAELKPRELVLGGSDRNADPANKNALGSYKRIRIKKVKSNPRGNHRR